MNPISLELNLTMAQTHARPRVRDKGSWKAVARHTGENSRKTHTPERPALCFHIYLFSRKNPQFSVPSCQKNLQIMMPCASDLWIFSFSFLLYLCKYMLSKSQPATVSHVVEPTTQGHPGDKTEGRDLG